MLLMTSIMPRDDAVSIDDSGQCFLSVTWFEKLLVCAYNGSD